jgi:hypothetical protein
MSFGFFFHDTKIRKYANIDAVFRLFVQSKSFNLLRLVGHVQKLNAGQGLLFLTDIIKVCVEQTSCCWVVLSLSEAFLKQCLHGCMISVTKIMSYIDITIHLKFAGPCVVIQFK